MTAVNQSLTSVVIVSYHTGAVLFEAISSVLAQTAPLELLLIDNGNPPDVSDRMRVLAARDERLHLFSGQGNVGFSKGCNIGAHAAKGEKLLFLNPDSMMPPDVISKLNEYGASLKRPYMIGARLVGADGKDQRGCRRALLTPVTAFIEALHLGVLFPHRRFNRHEEPLPATLTSIPAISGACMFLPRDDFWNMGGFDENYFLHVDDLDLCLRFRRKGGEIYFAPDVMVTHFAGTSIACPSFLERHKARGFMRYFHKNFGGQYPKPLLWLLDAAIYVRMGVRMSLAALR